MSDVLLNIHLASHDFLAKTNRSGSQSLTFYLTFYSKFKLAFFITIAGYEISERKSGR